MDGHSIYRRNRGVFPAALGLHKWLQQAGRTSMNMFYVVGAVVAVGLLIYLLAALLNAEDL
ncbi:F subunit of K+-transporting ATPase [compost metagenome]